MSGSLNILLQIGLGRVRVVEGVWKKEWKQIGRALEQTGSRRTWLQLVHCTLMQTGVLFQKADQTEKETGETEVNIQTGDTRGNI